MNQLSNMQDEPTSVDIPSTSTETNPQNETPTTNEYNASHYKKSVDHENDVSDEEEPEEQEGTLSEISILVATSIVKCCLEQLCKSKSSYVSNNEWHKYMYYNTTIIAMQLKNPGTLCQTLWFR